MAAFAFFGENFDGGIGVGLGGAVGLVGNVGYVVEENGISIWVGLDGDVFGLLPEFFGVESGVGAAEENQGDDERGYVFNFHVPSI